MTVAALEAPRARDRAAVTGPLLLGALAGALVAGRVEVAAACVLVAVGTSGAAGARRPARAWWTALAWGSGIAVLLNLYLVEGRALALPPLFGRAATFEGLGYGVLLSLRLAGAMTAVHGLRAAWPGEAGIDRMARALAPLERLRIPVQSMRAALGLALRMAPLVASEHRRIRRLQDARAGGPARGWRARLARERAVAIPAVVGALESAERLALALEARHYRVRPVGRGAPSHPLAIAAGWGLVLVSLFFRN